MKIDHCKICDNKKVDIPKGITCEKTGRKPEFVKQCDIITLNNNMEERVVQINETIFLVKRIKADAYFHLILFVSIGVVMMIGGYLFGRYVLDMGVISTVPVIIMGIGLLVFSFAFGPFNKYNRDIKAALAEKKRLDETLLKYNMSYQIDFKIEDKIHDDLILKYDLTFDKVRK